MKRANFLKKLGLGIGVAIVAPKVLAETTKDDGRKDRLRERPLYRRKDPQKGFEMSNALFVGYVYWDKGGNKHAVYF